MFKIIKLINGVVQDYDGLGVVQDYDGLGVVQDYDGLGVVQDYDGLGVVQDYDGLGVVPFFFLVNRRMNSVVWKILTFLVKQINLKVSALGNHSTVPHMLFS